jgi:hypothetical protein
VLVTGQIDHAGQRPRATPALVDVMPQMLIDVQTPHAIESGRILSHRIQPWLDAAPHGPPRRPQLLGQTLDRGMLGVEPVDGVLQHIERLAR